MNQEASPNPKVIGTAGHIDHGKTTLIYSLTGIDADRLPEEKQRGMTIDLGFAFIDLPRHGRVGIVDVPGHEAYVRNMLAGATGLDLGLLVVAADDAVMPQTREHLEILSLLGVPAVVCALTKTDLVDEEMKLLAHEEIQEFLAQTAYEGAPIVPVSSTTGQGLDELRHHLDAALGRVARARAGHRFRLPVDRSFTLLGIGCVVTGTVWSGHVSVGEELELQPVETKVKVRQLHAHGRSVTTVEAGQRAALNLAGVKASDIQRGYVLAPRGAMRAWPFLDVDLCLLPSAPRPVETFRRVRLHLGTAEVFADVVLAGAAELQPGQRACCQLRLESPIVAARGDRFVIRQESPLMTLGGGVVLMPSDRKLRTKDADRLADLQELRAGSLETAVRTVYRWHGLTPPSLEELAVILTASPERVQAAVARLCQERELIQLPGETVLETQRYRHLAERVIATLGELHKRSPAKPALPFLQISNALAGLDDRLLDGATKQLVIDGAIEEAKGGFALPGHTQRLSPEEATIRATLLKKHDEHPFCPESTRAIAEEAGVSPEAVHAQCRLLQDEGELTQIAPGVFFRPEALRAAEEAAERLVARLGSFAVMDFRDELGTSRKYAVPLLEYLDNRKVTVRRPDSRRVLRGR
jgi:selenocysteine-specific elongation factor